ARTPALRGGAARTRGRRRAARAVAARSDRSLMASRPLLVFALDGTLADTWRDLATALNRTLAEEGLPIVDGPQVKFWIGHGVRPLLARAVPNAESARPDPLYTRSAGHYERGCLDTTRLYDGIEECLAACRGADLAVASNKPAAFLLPMVERLRPAPPFAAALRRRTP